MINISKLVFEHPMAMFDHMARLLRRTLLTGSSLKATLLNKSAVGKGLPPHG